MAAGNKLIGIDQTLRGYKQSDIGVDDVAIGKYTLVTFTNTSLRNIGLRNLAGQSMSSQAPMRVMMRSTSTSGTTGTQIVKVVTNDINIAIPSAATFGLNSAVSGTLHVYLVDAGSNGMQLGVCGMSSIAPEKLVTDIAEIGGATPTSQTTLYTSGSLSGTSSVAVVYLGAVKFIFSGSIVWTSPLDVLVVPPAPKLPFGQFDFETNGSNFSGSINTHIRNLTVNTINLNNVATQIFGNTENSGIGFRVSEYGLYRVSYIDRATSASVIIGVSKNISGSDFTANFTTLATAKRLTWAAGPSGQYASATTQAILNEGDVVYPHHNGSVNDTLARFSLLRIG